MYQWGKIGVLICALMASGCDMIADLPIGNGYAAKNICSGLFVSQLDENTLIDRYVAPQIEPLPLLWQIDIDYDQQTVTVQDKIFKKLYASRAYYRDGFGCTLTFKEPLEKLDRQTPAPYGRALSVNQYWPQGAAGIDPQAQANVNMSVIDAAIDDAFEETEGNTRNTMAVAVVHQGKLVAERYAEGADETTRLIGWSMSKSVTSTLVGLLSDRGLLDVKAPAPVPEWQGTEKEAITLEHLLHMASGLEWFEESRGPNHDQGYILHRTKDFARFYLEQPLVATPGEVYNYSTGETSLIGRIIQDTVGGTLADSYRFIKEALFIPIQIESAVVEYDTVGQPATGAYVWMTARDWARLGLLYLNGGNWYGQQILSKEWIDYALTPSPANPEYAAQIWVNTHKSVWPSLPESTFAFLGHQAQRVIVVPDYDLVVVRLGFTFEDGADQTEQLVARIIEGL